MKNLNLRIVVECTHNYEQSGRFGNTDKSTDRNKSGAFSFIEFRRTVQGPIKYSHKCYYVIYFVNNNNNFPIKSKVMEFRSKNKKQSFLFHQIIRSKVIALLNAKSDDPIIKQLSQLKIDVFPDIKVPIKHIYRNKIPKRFIVKKPQHSENQ